MIRFNCPNCGKTCKAPVNTAGKSAACPKCKTRLKVPLSMASVAGTQAPVPQEPLPVPDQPPAERRSKVFLLLTGVLAMGSLLLLLGFGFGGLRKNREGGSRVSATTRVQAALQEPD